MPVINLPNNWKPREDQEPLWRYMHAGGKRASIVAHRRWGKDDVALHFTACALHERIGTYWHMLPQKNQARKAIWEAVNPRTGKRRIDEAFPHELRANTRDDEMFIRFKCGSTWQVIGSDAYDALVGTPPIGVVFSEWALSNPQSWSMIRPIMAENNGWAMFITTPRGRNHAFKTHETAMRSDEWFGQLLTAADTSVYKPEVLERERRELLDERGETDGEAIFEQEYMCSWSAALPGAYYARDVDKIERLGQIAPIAHNPARQVHTAWDLGASDQTVIWFVQWTGTGWAFIDYLASSGMGPAWYWAELQGLGSPESAHRKAYTFGEHLVPHDAAHERLGIGMVEAISIKASMEAIGMRNVRVVPRTASVANDINECRKMLPICYFDKERCAHGIDAMRSYRREWDEKHKVYKDRPLHDWASNPADGFRTFAIGKPRDMLAPRYEDDDEDIQRFGPVSGY